MDASDIIGGKNQAGEKGLIEAEINRRLNQKQYLSQNSSTSLKHLLSIAFPRSFCAIAQCELHSLLIQYLTTVSSFSEARLGRPSASILASSNSLLIYTSNHGRFGNIIDSLSQILLPALIPTTQWHSDNASQNLSSIPHPRLPSEEVSSTTTTDPATSRAQTPPSCPLLATSRDPSARRGSQKSSREMSRLQT